MAFKNRSKSLLSKLRKDENELCPWNFNFELELSDRTMDLYSPTRIDRDKWVYIFKLICDMNAKLISTKTMTPLQYEKQRKNE